MHFFDHVNLHSQLALHKVGNISIDEHLLLSTEPVIISSALRTPLLQYFCSPFSSDAYYQFYHETDLSLNEVYVFSQKVFANKNQLFEQSISIAKHLYAKSNHPRVKGGELFVAYLEGCKVDSRITDAIGIFKSETKDTFLEIEDANGGLSVANKQGMNINKLDKGCIIFNVQPELGYLVAVVDNTNRNGEAHYWVDHFLGLHVHKNEYQQTAQFLGVTKKYVSHKMSEDFEISKADQIDLLNKSMDYFKKNGEFDKEDFEAKVFQERSLIESFRKFESEYNSENALKMDDNFTISTSAVKKYSRTFKSILKLDKNFHIYIHGDRTLIEKGKDEDGRKFYKIYY